MANEPNDPEALSPEEETSWLFKPVSAPFLSEETGEAFKVCSTCDADCSHSMRIFKTFWNGKWIFECALCLACEEALNRGYSEESKRKLDEWWGSKQLPPGLQGKILDWCTCRRCGEQFSIAPGNTFHLTAWIEEGELFGAYGLCEHCLIEADDCYSDETREFRDRFLAKLLTPPVGDSIRREPVFI